MYFDQLTHCITGEYFTHLQHDEQAQEDLEMQLSTFKLHIMTRVAFETAPYCMVKLSATMLGGFTVLKTGFQHPQQIK